jgi:hypothetical protein
MGYNSSKKGHLKNKRRKLASARKRKRKESLEKKKS